MLHCPRNNRAHINVFRHLFWLPVLPRRWWLTAPATGRWPMGSPTSESRNATAACGAWWPGRNTRAAATRNNPDASKQSRPTLGMPILIDMKKKAGVADTWEGQVYNAKDGQLYSSTIKPAGTDQLEIQGCVLGFLCGGETWSRVAPPFPRAPPTAWPRARRRAPPLRCPKVRQPPPHRHRRPPARWPRRRSRVRSRRPASPAISAISAYSPTSRGLPIKAGWNSSTAASVVTNDSGSNLPVLAMPG